MNLSLLRRFPVTILISLLALLIAPALDALAEAPQGDAAEALKLIDGAPSDTGFESQFAEIRGDIHLANGATEQAIESYRTSLDLLEDGVGNRQLLTMKLEALGADIDNTDGGEM